MRSLMLAYVSGFVAVALVASVLLFAPFESAAAQANGDGGAVAESSVVLLDEPCLVYSSTGGDGPLAGGESRPVQVTGSLPSSQGGEADCQVPVDAVSVVLSVGAVDAQTLGNLRVSEGGVAPAGGVVNYAPNGLDNTNTIVVPLSGSGEVDVSANAGPNGVGVPSADVRVVVVGYNGPSDVSSVVTPVVPCAVSDSRSSQGSSGDFVGPFSSVDVIPLIDVAGVIPAAQGGGNADCGVPDSATGVIANVVAIGATGTGFMAAGTADATPVLHTTAFAPIGMNNAAVAWIPLDADGTINVDAVTTDGAAHLRVVVVGFISTSDDVTTGFTAVAPCAAFDSRSTQGLSLIHI